MPRSRLLPQPCFFETPSRLRISRDKRHTSYVRPTERYGGGCGKYKNGTYTVLIPHSFATEPNSSIAKRMRASIVLTGPVLARYGEVSFPHPGGCVIGARPLDLFVDGFEKMGAKVSIGRLVCCGSKKWTQGAEFFLKIRA